MIGYILIAAGILLIYISARYIRRPRNKKNQEAKQVDKNVVSWTMECPTHSAHVFFESNGDYCPECGAHGIRKPLEVRCPHCAGTIPAYVTKFCARCGKDLRNA